MVKTEEVSKGTILRNLADGALYRVEAVHGTASTGYMQLTRLDKSGKAISYSRLNVYRNVSIDKNIAGVNIDMVAALLSNCEIVDPVVLPAAKTKLSTDVKKRLFSSYSVEDCIYLGSLLDKLPEPNILIAALDEYGFKMELEAESEADESDEVDEEAETEEAA